MQGEPKRKRQREASSQTDEEANDSLIDEQDGDYVESPSHSCWQEDITSKINKLLSILPMFEELKQQFKELKEQNRQLRESLATKTQEVTNLKVTDTTNSLKI